MIPNLLLLLAALALLHTLAVRVTRPLIFRIDFRVSWSEAREAGRLGIRPGVVRNREELLSRLRNREGIRQETLLQGARERKLHRRNPRWAA